MKSASPSTARLCPLIILFCLLAVPHGARAQGGPTVTPDLFGEPVDIVTPGYLHWDRPSGDTVDPDGDERDIDNNFGEHNGGVDEPTFSSQVKAYGAGSVGPEFAYVYGTNTIHWEFRPPGPGSYVISTLLWKELSAPTKIVFSYRRGDEWVDLPAVEGVREWPHFGKLGCWRVEVPKNQLTLPIRVRAESGRGLLHRILLGKLRTESPFTSPAQPTAHPSMYFRTEDLPALRKKVRSGPAKLAYDYMVQRAKAYPRRVGGWKRRGAHVVGRSIIQTAFVSAMTGDDAHLKSVLRMIDKVMSWDHGPDVVKVQMSKTDHYNVLERGRQLSAIVLAYDWCYERMSPEQRRRIRRFIEAEANRLYVYNECMVGNVDSGNWDPWIGAGYGMAGILLRDEHKWADKWIESEKRIFGLNLRHSAEDFGYFMNGFVKALDFGICLKTATGEDIFAPDAERLRALLDYRMTLLTPQRDGYPKFGDASAQNDPVLALCLATYLRDPMAQWFVNNLSCADPRQVGRWGWNHMMPVAVVTMYDAGLKEQTPDVPRLSLGRSFSDESRLSPGLRPVTVLRTGYGRATDVQFSMRCGDFAGWHGHPSQGSFILTAYGDHMTTDLAMGAPYGTPQSDFSKSAQAHCTVMIDGKGQEKYSDPVYGYDLEAGHPGPLLHTDFVDHMLTENAAAYRKNPSLKKLDHAYRHFVFVRRPNRRAYVVILDDIRLDDRPRVYEWLLQTDTEHKVTSEESNRQLISGRALLDVITTDPPSIVVEKVDTLRRWRTLKIRSGSPVVTGRFVNVLYPRTSRMPLPPVTRLAGRSATGARIGTKENGEAVLFATGDSPIEEAGVSTDAKLAAVGSKGGRAQWFLCVGGTRMELDGKLLFRSDAPVTVALDAARNGQISAAGPAEVSIVFGKGESATVNVAAGILTVRRGRPIAGGKR